MTDHDDIEPPHASSATDLVLNELRLFGYRPFDDQPDPRPLPEGKTIAGAVAAAELPLDSDFEIRAHASHRLWRAINGRPPGPPFHQLSAQRRERLALALRALDAHVDGASYREIAEALYGRKRISEGAWKTSEFRSGTIRLVRAGLGLMRGGYRRLLRPPSRKK